jgi:hypothetical protein
VVVYGTLVLRGCFKQAAIVAILFLISLPTLAQEQSDTPVRLLSEILGEEREYWDPHGRTYVDLTQSEMKGLMSGFQHTVGNLITQLSYLQINVSRRRDEVDDRQAELIELLSRLTMQLAEKWLQMKIPRDASLFYDHDFSSHMGLLQAYESLKIMREVLKQIEMSEELSAQMHGVMIHAINVVEFSLRVLEDQQQEVSGDLFWDIPSVVQLAQFREVQLALQNGKIFNSGIIETIFANGREAQFIPRVIFASFLADHFMNCESGAEPLFYYNEGGFRIDLPYRVLSPWDVLGRGGYGLLVLLGKLFFEHAYGAQLGGSRLLRLGTGVRLWVPLPSGFSTETVALPEVRSLASAVKLILTQGKPTRQIEESTEVHRLADILATDFLDTHREHEGLLPGDVLIEFVRGTEAGQVIDVKGLAENVEALNTDLRFLDGETLRGSLRRNVRLVK